MEILGHKRINTVWVTFCSRQPVRTGLFIVRVWRTPLRPVPPGRRVYHSLVVTVTAGPSPPDVCFLDPQFIFPQHITSLVLKESFTFWLVESLGLARLTRQTRTNYICLTFCELLKSKTKYWTNWDAEQVWRWSLTEISLVPSHFQKALSSFIRGEAPVLSSHGTNGCFWTNQESKQLFAASHGSHIIHSFIKYWDFSATAVHSMSSAASCRWCESP